MKRAGCAWSEGGGCPSRVNFSSKNLEYTLPTPTYHTPRISNSFTMGSIWDFSPIITSPRSQPISLNSDNYHDAVICTSSNRSRESVEWQQLQIGGKRCAAKISSVQHNQTNYFDTAMLVYFDFIIAYNDNTRSQQIQPS